MKMLEKLSALEDAMNMLSSNARVIFVGQNVVYPGAATFKALAGVPEAQRVEFPVAEDMQMGFCIGLSLLGYIPVCIYPRFDFLVLAMNQLVNHLDKLRTASQDAWKPGVIIRTRVGAKRPLDAGPQHTQDHTVALCSMFQSVKVVSIYSDYQAFATYSGALDRAERGYSSVVVEAM